MLIPDPSWKGGCLNMPTCATKKGTSQFRIVTQSKRIPAVACIKLTPQKHRYNAKVRALTEGISDFLCSSGGQAPKHRPQREN